MRHFLAEYETHGTFRGCCSVGFRWQDMENTHLRDSLKVPPSLLRDSSWPQQQLGHTCCVKQHCASRTRPCGPIFMRQISNTLLDAALLWHPSPGQ